MNNKQQEKTIREMYKNKTELLDKLRSGDGKTVLEAYKKVFPQVKRALTKIGCDDKQASNLAEEAFVKTWEIIKERPDFEEKDSGIIGYIVKVGKNMALKLLKKESKQINGREEYLLTLTDENNNPEVELIRSENQALIRKIFQSLDKECREVIIRAVVDKEKQKIIADEMNMKYGSLRNKITECKSKFKQLYNHLKSN